MLFVIESNNKMKKVRKMKSDYAYLNIKTFDIEEREDIIPLDEQLAKTISILNKKGYYTEAFNRARISKPFLVGAIIHDLVEEGLLEINNNTKDKIKNIIKKSDYESTFIIFKEEYKFNNLPNGYILIGKDLSYNLSTLKDDEDINIKTLLELDKEYDSSLHALEEWANELPNR